MELFNDSDNEGDLGDVPPSENVILSTPKPTPKPRAKKLKTGGDMGVTRVDKRSVKDDKSRQEMLERLEKARVKALEVRQKNKAERDLVAKEEKDKVEKVASFLKNDDLFEKKYATKFDKITDMLSNVETYLSEVKDVKKKKLAIKEEEKLHKEKAMAMVKEDLQKLHEAEAKVKEADEKAKLKVDLKAKDVALIKTCNPVPLTTLPNYRNMNFGRRGRGHY
jgi:hypothetical protein